MDEDGTSNLIGSFNVASPSPRMTSHPLKFRDQVMWPIYIFCVAAIIYLERLKLKLSYFVYWLCRVLAYGWQTTLTGAWSRSNDPFKILWAISCGTAKTRIVKFCVHLKNLEYVIVLALWLRSTPSWASSWSRELFLKIFRPSHIFGISENMHFKFHVLINAEEY